MFLAEPAVEVGADGSVFGITGELTHLVDVVDHFVIFSGDGDFRILIEALQRKGRKVSVVSTITSQPPMVSDDVRRQCDHFVDLVSLKEEIGRAPSERPAPRRYEQDVADEVDL